ncbi:hypothetical protein BGZ61DRAFT_489907 [Ilyonectria robusta]|uniref:uncharacterized protein n=1 Tax=Ilyonectria robusta TaxID=1079257 RepID=UPI001E8D7D69|nr:uncharacterized protein BGZ61DRAFT_489907 [Ilyonectria robusta]KAH8736178.1 hypothetical protein BGZ61DRAFT_489907 [Ilyonectria robusta]
MAILARAVVLAACISSLANAQTINVDGRVVVANEGTVSAAAESADDNLELTDAVLANLTDLHLTDIDLFKFGDDGESAYKRGLGFASCKTMPGDLAWPGKVVWKVFNLLTGGALIKTVPFGAVCYQGEHYDADACARIIDNWTNSDTHDEDPTANMYPLFEGNACLPQDAGKEGATCQLGGLPVYSVNATSASQVQLAVNFARTLNLRLVIRNTGHDFLGKSTGAGALNIWTHNLKKMQFIKTYKSAGSYKGPAFKIGAGIQVVELYEAANKHGYTAVGGECRTVGVAGGYTAMGGHSPMSPIAGLGSDQVLSLEIVTPDGRLVTADEKNNSELFWAVRGGGGATFGVVISFTVRVWPKMTFSGVTWSLATADANISKDVFWKGMRTYWAKFPEYNDNNTYGYSVMFPTGNDTYSWSMLPWLVPGMELPAFKSMVAPLLEEWKSIGFNVEPEFFTHDNFYDTWKNHFPTESVGASNVRTASRLIPRKNWDNADLREETFDAVQSIVEEGSVLISYNINGAAPKGVAASALNPAWRDVSMFAIIGSGWDVAGSSPEAILATNKKITNDWMQRLRDVSPGSGGYGNEGDVMEPDFGQAFYGADNYKRLYALKKKLDPWGVFYAPTGVGSEDWEITQVSDFVDGLLYSDLLETLSTWLTLQTGRLCRK